MEPSDPVLIRESLAGSLGAFDDLMARYERLVFKVALSYGKDRQDALDITQNVFLRAYEKLGSLRGNKSFKAWILSIACHEGIDWVRKQRRHGGHDPVDENLPVSCDQRSQEEFVLQREKAEFLLRSLSCLNPKQRLVVVLKYYEGMSIREIGDVLNCSEALAKNILYRSLDRLRLRLVQAGYCNEQLQRIPETAQKNGGR